MAKSRWELRLSDTKGDECRLRLAISYSVFNKEKNKNEYKILRYSTDYMINKDHWENHRLKTKDSPRDERLKRDKINSEIDELKDKIDDVFKELNSRYEIVKPSDIRRVLEEKKRERSKDLGFVNVWKEYLLVKKANLKPTTVVKFSSTYNKVIEYDKAVEVDRMDSKWLSDFRNYCTNPSKANLTNQTTNKYIEQVKTFLNWCVKQDYITREQREKIRENSSDLVLKTVENKKVVLTKSDLERLRKLELTAPYLINVRSLFILSCLTGLRFSDYSTIKAQHLKQDEEGNFYLEKRQEKTSNEVVVPLTEESLSIVNDLIEGKVKAISNQKVNDYLKNLFKMEEMEFSEEIEAHKRQGGNVNTELKKKWELVTSHTGRRTFATLGLMQGLPEKVVMLFTGHTDYKSFAKYVNIPKVDETRMMRNALNNF